jgi:hypothetical protein
MKYLATLLVLAVAVSVASADISVAVESAPVPVAGMESYVYNDVVVTTDSDWMRAVLVVIPDDPAKVYQDAFGGITSPLPAFFPTFPALEYDTYVSNGVVGEPVSVLAAASVGRTVLEFTTDTDPSHAELAVEYYTVDIDDTGELSLARVTLANTTSGTWFFLATASPAGGPMVVAEGPIVEGEMVPEPMTLSLLARKK